MVEAGGTRRDTKVRGEIIDDDVAKAEVDNVTAGGFFQCFGREQEPGRSIPRLSFPLGVHAAGILGGRSSEQDRLAAANPASLPPARPPAQGAAEV